MPDTSPASPQFRMADRMVDGRLGAILTEYRVAGLSFEGMAKQLYADHGIEVTGQTLRRWGRDLGLTTGSAA